MQKFKLLFGVLPGKQLNMNRFSSPSLTKSYLPVIGFLVLFAIYHLPELFQNYYQKPLIWLLETGMLLFVIVAYFIGKRKFKNGFTTYGLFAFRKHWGNLAKGVLIGTSITILANLIPVWLHWNKISIQWDWQQILIYSVLFAVGTILPSLAEDILTRGYIMAYWPGKWNATLLILFSAGVYVLNHIFRLNKPDVLLYLFVLGLVLIWAFVATRSLWLTLGIHWGSNIAYQFFANAAAFETIEDTGTENYLLAVCYVLGFALVFLLFKRGFFTLAGKPGD
jgi:uncharacterized protein